MKTLTRLCLVFVMVAVASTMVYAGRPQCETPWLTPDSRVCFWDNAAFGWDIWITRCAGEPGLETCIVYFTASNDFVRNKPGEEPFVLLADQAVDFFVCPAPGGIDCLIKFFTTNYPVPVAEMYVGKGHLTAAGYIHPDTGQFSCPSTIQARGTVSGPTGTEYLINDHVLRVKSAGNVEGCKTLMNSITVTPTK